jgi:hypothetical protein
MKTLFFAASLALLVLFSFVGIIVGAGTMIYDLYSSGPNFMQGFTIFSLSSILFLVSVTAFIATKILTNTEIMADVMAKFVAHEMKKEMSGGGNPLQQFLQNLGMGGGFPGMPNISGSIKMASVDEDGNITPLGEKEFKNPEEFLKYRNEILQKAFGKNPTKTKKKFEEMSIQELESEEQKAIDSQNFELAAAVRDLIKEKRKG